ncbi:MAG TPA: DEAD/DEAH box helicase [Thermoanaerobaculia bacterium]|jgi:ATP-dependent RNA helicase DeaD
MSEATGATFAELGLRAELVDTLSALGYEAPTPIQDRTIPVLLSGRDLIGQAQTGTGKTAAFALPLLEKIDLESRATQALVLAPTRELAMQVAEAIHSYAGKLGAISVLPIYGGAPIYHQLKRLERGVHVVVGTPGRLIDMLDRGALQLGSVKLIVLDEADEMLKMGFLEEVEKILAAAPAERQTALFSATMPDEVLRISKRYLRNPERVEIEHKALTAPAIEQRFLNVSEGQKLEVLTQILELEENDAVLIFRRTKNGAAELAEKLEGRGFAAAAMHGDMNQAMRENVIRRLRAGQVEVVVATDVAARGLDVEQITHVINYDIPHDVEVYVHRIGRTGRAGRSGIATIFITPRERRMLREIERYTGSAVKPMKMPTRADVAARRISVFKESLRKELQQGDLDLYVELVEQLADEGQHDITEVAAAAAKMANGSRSLAAPEEPRYAPPASAPAPRERERERDREDYTPARAPIPRVFAEKAPRPDRGEDDDDEPKARLAMAVGKRDGIRPADVVGSIANEADVPGREIGLIDIREEVTYVTIPERHVENVLAKVGRAKFRGRPVNMRRAPEGEGSAPERPALRRFGERSGKFEGRPPRRDFGAPPRRDFNDRPKRDFDGPPRREGGAPPRRDDRPPRRDFGAPPRREGSAPPRRDDRPPRREFGNRDDRPPRRDFGGGGGGADRPPRRFGDRPPFGPPRPFKPKKR